MRTHSSGRVKSFVIMREMQCAGVRFYILQGTMWAMQCIPSSRKTYPCQHSQVDSRMNIHAEGSTNVYLKTVFVLFLREPVKSTIIMLYELRESTFTKTPTSLPIYMHRDLLLTPINVTFKTKIKMSWTPELSEQHLYLTQVTKLNVNSAVLIDVYRGICNNILARLHFQLNTVTFSVMFEWQ
jgi:hypothetical protein